jgi:hypothetical protein
MALDFISQKSRKGVLEDRSPGGSEGLRVLADEIGVAHEQLLAWIKSDLMTGMQSLTTKDAVLTNDDPPQ